ncbi:hypothetical protein BVC71_07520 [Marivivens niveibacter]|uniref:L,D-TPase catalytic domain-containing protein n=1 Tax=Marivivens niveibacter TaxID=1930667 RepID=A0A251WZW1_9RHOB|nr:L,D-transpeptidase family protein [Marivivens niveibacter]OUD09675.1 hypothetical protein BVC71_07520 [Marivivens niveibacter]
MFTRRSFILALGAGLAGCTTPRFKTYDGPDVTGIYVSKSQRRLYLMNNDSVLADYAMKLGFAPEGHKQFEGDGRTPEGLYVIDRQNPNSAFHLSLGISYPNAQDRAFARSQGRSPGGDIFIHGTPSHVDANTDWTAGCIAVHNHEIEDIFAMVKTGTPILIVA